MRKLDLFGCEGIGASGYRRAGFEVFGVDLDKNRLKYYPYPSRLDDAVSLVWDMLSGLPVLFSDGQYLNINDFDAIHASPPCQGYTRGNAGKATKWPKLIPEVREALQVTGKPYILENVEDAGPEMIDPVTLCGCMFDLSTIDTDGIRIHLKRPRLFETNWELTPPRPCNHEGIEWFAGAYGGARRDKYEAKYVRKGGYVPRDKYVVQALLGVTHNVTWQGLFECIPPRYTEHIGKQLLTLIDTNSEAA